MTVIALVVVALPAASTSPDSDAVSSTDDEWPNKIGPTSVSRYEPVGSNTMLNSEVPTSSVCRHAPVRASQILTVRSSEADASCRESCEKTTDQTEPLWPSSVCRHAPVRASQILTVRSSEADASCRESCEKTTDQTEPLWPSSVCRHAPVRASQILTVRSPEADASCRESCEKTTDVTQPLWPSSVCRHAPVRASQILTVSIARSRRELP